MSLFDVKQIMRTYEKDMAKETTERNDVVSIIEKQLNIKVIVIFAVAKTRLATAGSKKYRI